MCTRLGSYPRQRFWALDFGQPSMDDTSSQSNITIRVVLRTFGHIGPKCDLISWLRWRQPQTRVRLPDLNANGYGLPHLVRGWTHRFMSQMCRCTIDPLTSMAQPLAEV